MRAVVIFLICGVAAYIYWLNGRTIFEARNNPSEEELKIIHEIIAYEQEKLSEYKEFLLQYEDKCKELGVELIPEFNQMRAVNQQGLVEKHDWDHDLWMPKFYNSLTICSVYHNGRKLEYQTGNTTSQFVDIVWLLRAGRNEDTVYNPTPFDGFDLTIDRLLEQVSAHLQK